MSLLSRRPRAGIVADVAGSSLIGSGPIRLADLAHGSEGTVRSVSTDDPLGLRMMELGLTPGTRVRLLGAAPLGDPLRVAVRGYRLGLRRNEANLILVDRREKETGVDLA
jgi:ferrous iron transport protein A